VWRADPIIDEDMMKFVSVSDEELFAPVVDYSHFYPTGEGRRFSAKSPMRSSRVVPLK